MDLYILVMKLVFVVMPGLIRGVNEEIKEITLKTTKIVLIPIEKCLSPWEQSGYIQGL